MKTLLVTLAFLCALPALAVTVGDAAPDFSGTASNGKTIKLSDFKGSYVVLEWHNQGCPYVKKFYGKGDMQKLQKDWKAKGVKWLTVLSSAKGKQGNITAEQENAYLKANGAAPTAALMDADGTIAKAYQAKTTPHMFVIDPAGKLIYNGAIDDNSSADQADIAKAKNYVSAALTEAMDGKAVTVASKAPYGCSVKY